MTSKKDKARNSADEHMHLAAECFEAGDYHSAAFYGASALKLYSQAQDGDGVQKMKPLVVKYNTALEPLLVSREINIPAKDLDELNDAVEELLQTYLAPRNLADCLNAMFNTSSIFPNFEEAQELARTSKPVTSIFTSHMSIGARGHLKSFDSFENSYLSEMYGLHLNYFTGIVNMTFSRLTLQKKLTRKKLLTVMLAKRMYPADILLRLDGAVERQFKNDYISSLSIIIPLFEYTFLYVSNGLGLDSYTFKGANTTTQNKTLSTNILMSKEFQDVWGRDFCVLLNYFLYDNNGIGLRHSVAHGDATLQQYSYGNFNVVLYFLLYVTLTPATKG